MPVNIAPSDAVVEDNQPIRSDQILAKVAGVTACALGGAALGAVLGVGEKDPSRSIIGAVCGGLGGIAFGLGFVSQANCATWIARARRPVVSQELPR